ANPFGLGCKATDGLTACSGAACFYGPNGFARATTTPWDGSHIISDSGACRLGSTIGYTGPQVFVDATGTVPTGLNCPSLIAFIQQAYGTPPTPQSVVSVTYPLAQNAGDLNIIVVGWNDATTTAQSVSDSKGNTYALAIGPTTGTGVRQSIYYASNIVA